jgi:polyhydroxyalkanoate synthase
LRAQQSSLQSTSPQSRESGEETADELGVGKAFTDLAAKLLTDPFKLAEAGMRMWQDHFMLWQNTMKRAMGEESAPVAQAATSDNRFRSELWQNNLVFDYIKQSYLIAARTFRRPSPKSLASTRRPRAR